MKISKFNSLFALLCLYQIGICCAQADTLYREGNSLGQDTFINLDPSMAGKTLAVYAVSENPDFQSVDIAVQGIEGAVVTAESFAIDGGENVLEALPQTTPLALWFNGSRFDRMLLQSHDLRCGCLTETEKAQKLAQYQVWWPGLTMEQMCDIVMLSDGAQCGDDVLVGGDSGSIPPIYATAFVSYNRCIPSFRPGVVVKVDLTNVPASSLQDRHLVVVIRIRRFFGRSGSNWAKFKVSDGKKFPGWIALTEVVSPDGTLDDIQFVDWSAGGNGKAVARARNIPKRGDALFYGSRLYKRTPIGKFLTGGRGTVEVSRYGEGYGFCAKFTKRARQNFNGFRKQG
jgi:hypothetical protein